MAGTSTNKVNIITRGGANIVHFETGWISCSDWTNVALGNIAPNSNCIHNLNATLAELWIKTIVSNIAGYSNVTQELIPVDDTTSRDGGLGVTFVDVNTINIQTGNNGVSLVDKQNAGITWVLDNESWYYKIIIKKFVL